MDAIKGVEGEEEGDDNGRKDLPDRKFTDPVRDSKSINWQNLLPRLYTLIRIFCPPSLQEKEDYILRILFYFKI